MLLHNKKKETTALKPQYPLWNQLYLQESTEGYIGSPVYLQGMEGQTSIQNIQIGVALC